MTNASASIGGGVYLLLGENGAGKSTLLRTLSAFQTPLRGDISIVGRSLDSYSETELAKVIGVVLTDKIGVNNMTVAQLVGLGRSPYTGFWGTLGVSPNLKSAIVTLPLPSAFAISKFTVRFPI